MTPRSVRIGVSLGDPAGIGPEVVEKAARIFLSNDPAASLVLFGPVGLAETIADRLGSRVAAQTQKPFYGPVGKPSRESGQAALDALTAVIESAQGGNIDAICTAPLSKQALALAGQFDRGHTEILSRHLADGPVAMAFFSKSLKVALTSAHLPLKQAIEELSSQRVVEVAKLFDHALRHDLGVDEPRLALAGLNPHAGESGLLGVEEREILKPATLVAQQEGVDLSGPFPADAVFRRCMAGDFDGVVALYHDQGLIPIKLLEFGEAVNITLGLRVPRTSPDHGTGYDLVGTHRAHPEGMLAALRWAARLGRRSEHGFSS